MRAIVLWSVVGAVGFAVADTALTNVGVELVRRRHRRVLLRADAVQLDAELRGPAPSRCACSHCTGGDGTGPAR